MGHRKHISRISNKGTGLMRKVGQKVPDEARPIPVVETIYYKIIEMDERNVPDRRVEVDVGDFIMIVNPSASGLGREIYEYGTRKNESSLGKVLNHISFDGMTYFDIGANWGYYVLAVGARNDGCDLVAFEPYPTNAEILERNLERNDIEATVVRKAVSDETRKNVAWDEDENLEEGSISPQEDGSDTDKSVETVTLEDYINEKGTSSVDLVKIDVEGAENLVLRGFGDIWERIDGMIVELHTGNIIEGSAREIIEKLNSKGYQLYYIDNNGGAGRLTEEEIAKKDLEKMFEMTPSTVHHLIALTPDSQIHNNLSEDIEQVIR